MQKTKRIIITGLAGLTIALLQPAAADSLSEKTNAAFKYADDNCRSDDYKKEGLLTPEHKAELLKILDGVPQQEIAKWVRERNDMLFFVSVQLVTDQRVLEDLLVTDTKWLHGGYRDGMYASDFRNAYYQLYKNVTDQELLMKLWKQDEISFSTESSTSYGYRDPAVLRQFDKEHLDMLNRQRIARRRAAHGRTVDVLGFYIGMPRQDFELLRFVRGLTDDDLTGSFGTWKKGPANRLWLSHRYTANLMNIKDGIVGLTLFTEKFIPGGEDTAGEIHANGDVKKTYDIENEEVGARVDTYWWRSCPKLACQVKLYDGGNLVIEADEKDVKFDLSEADKWMNEDFDETALDDLGNSSSGGGVFKIVVLLAIVCALLYFFRKKIEAFVATHPKYEKAWKLVCKAGNVSRECAVKALAFGKAKAEEIKNKKSK